MGQPLAETEVALTGGPVAPRGGDLGDAAAGKGGLDRQFELGIVGTVVITLVCAFALVCLAAERPDLDRPWIA